MTTKPSSRRRTPSSKPLAGHDALRPSGRKLWDFAVDEFEFEEHERAVLLEACRTVDLLDDLHAAVEAEGPVLDSPQGRKAHPAAVEARQQRIALARLLSALRIPSEDDERPQQRHGARGVYSLGRSA